MYSTIKTDLSLILKIESKLLVRFLSTQYYVSPISSIWWKHSHHAQFASFFLTYLNLDVIYKDIWW
jgi:hypothetical protein